jgi:four helix bundle protein
MGLICGSGDDISSQFSVLSSQFSVLSSQFSVLSSRGDADTAFLDAHSGNSSKVQALDVRASQPTERFCATILRGSLVGESYRDLIAWQKAMRLVTEIYQATRLFPKDETYGLTSQLRRAAVSVPSNIAEGQARFSRKEFHHFLSLARGSLVEIETQLIIAQNLNYLTPNQSQPALAKAAELGRILNGLIASIKKAA